MKTFIILVFTTFAGLHTFAQKDQAETPYQSRSLSKENIQFVNAATSGGSIRVESVPSNEARLEVYVRANNGKQLSRQEIEARMTENYNLDINISSHKLSVVTTPRTQNLSAKNSLMVSYKIYVPTDVSTNLKTSGGSIALLNLKGNQSFKTSGGSLYIDGLSGQVDGKTSGGSIDLKNSSNDIHLSTSGGSIRAENCKGNLVLETSGGSLKLTGLDGKIDATTSGGSISANDITGDLLAKTSGGSVRMNGLSCNLETSTAGGSMDIAFIKPVQNIKITNSAGSVRLQVPAGQGMDLNLSGSKVTTGNLKNFDGTIEKNSVEGKLNGGGNKVYVSSGSGSITLDLN